MKTTPPATNVNNVLVDSLEMLLEVSSMTVSLVDALMEVLVFSWIMNSSVLNALQAILEENVITVVKIIMESLRKGYPVRSVNVMKM